jgi:hypothetical protein
VQCQQLLRIYQRAHARKRRFILCAEHVGESLPVENQHPVLSGIKRFTLAPFQGLKHVNMVKPVPLQITERMFVQRNIHVVFPISTNL